MYTLHAYNVDMFGGIDTFLPDGAHRVALRQWMTHKAIHDVITDDPENPTTLVDTEIHYALEEYLPDMLSTMPQPVIDKVVEELRAYYFRVHEYFRKLNIAGSDLTQMKNKGVFVIIKD